MAVFLWRNADKPTPTGPHNFTDVPTTSFANTAIAWLVEAGITTGTTPTAGLLALRHSFAYPAGVAVAPNGIVYVGDVSNHRIRAINPTTGAVTTLAGSGTAGFADGPSNTAQFDNPSGVAVAPGGTVYVADRYNHRIRAINPTTGAVTTLAGSTIGFADGPGNTAQFNYPFGVAVAPGGTVYVADRNNHRIRAINPTTGAVTTFAGSGTAGFADGPGNTAQFNATAGVAVAPGGTVYVADRYNHRIRAINPTTGAVTTLAGSGTAGFADGPGDTAQFTGPIGLTVAPNGTVYLGDYFNHRIRTIT
ncbi:MAG: S-layer homology domain-containing protein [Candidatus Microthrix sp.]|nr:S-layer homology domain-containing protein [Candidatus Microthrix sp.]